MDMHANDKQALISAYPFLNDTHIHCAQCLTRLSCPIPPVLFCSSVPIFFSFRYVHNFIRLLVSGGCLVGRIIHEIVKLLCAFLVDLDLYNPAATGAIILGDVVDSLGLFLKNFVDLDDFASDGGKDVTSTLNRLHGSNIVAGLDPIARLRQFDVYYVTELFGGVGRDTNGTGLAVGRQINPLMGLGILSDKAYSIGCTTNNGQRQAGKLWGE